MKNILIIGLILFSCCSCNSFLKEYSQDLVRVQTIGDLDELLVGSAYYAAGYSYISNYNLYTVGESYNLSLHFMADELKQNTETSYGDLKKAFEDYFGYFTWQRDAGIDRRGTSVSDEGADWKKTYGYINATNMILHELGEVSVSGDKEEADKIRIEGESCFLRALYYFTLVNMYAEPYVPSKAEITPGVPLKLTPYVEDKEYSRTTLTEVYNQILEDLERAERCLEQSEHKSLYRADINAVYLLTSRVYLYMQDYKNARKYAQMVLDWNDALVDLKSFYDEDNVFTSQNPEVLFSMGGHFLSYYIYGDDYYSDEYPFYISDDLLNAFKSKEDLRKGIYIQEVEDDLYGYKKIYWGKAHFGSPCSVSDNFLFRTSEAYLNLAEAAAFDNDEATAREAITTLQNNRFSTPQTINESGNALIDLIREERQRELCLEGHRWFDLRRYMVCEKYPWTKTIRHLYTDFQSGYPYKPEGTRLFELLPNDKAYTLAFPKEVLDFQNTLSTNERPDRLPINQ